MRHTKIMLYPHLLWQELVQWGVQQADGHWKAIHGPEDALKVLHLVALCDTRQHRYTGKAAAAAAQRRWSGQKVGHLQKGPQKATGW